MSIIHADLAAGFCSLSDIALPEHLTEAGDGGGNGGMKTRSKNSPPNFTQNSATYTTSPTPSLRDVIT